MKKVHIVLIALFFTAYHTKPHIYLEPYSELAPNLKKLPAWNAQNPIRLHLGCGESHLKGYINIDFSGAEHTVQTKRAADIFADITKIVFTPQSVHEIRSHHVFEHFNRQTATALLCIWQYALKPNGILTIETPDFEESIKIISNPQYSYIQKQVVLRHIFGSHEASWAAHLEGWYEEKFRHTLTSLGFTILNCQKSRYGIIPNITVTAKKTQNFSTNELIKKAHSLLRESTVNQSDTENKIWRVWCTEFEAVFKKCIS